MPSLFILKCFYAGMPVFSPDIETSDLRTTLDDIKEELRKGNLRISFGSNQSSLATEVCIDVYDAPTKKYRHDVSVAYKV